MSETGKCWLFWSRSNIHDKQISDLRLKVNGDLNRFRDMVRIQMRISKNEHASEEQAAGYKRTYRGIDYADDDDWWYDWKDH